MIITEKFIKSLLNKAIPGLTEIIPTKIDKNRFQVTVCLGDDVAMLSIPEDAPKDTLADVINYCKEVFSRQLKIAG